MKKCVVLYLSLSFFCFLFVIPPAVMSVVPVRGKERRAEKTRKREKRVESNRSKNLPYSEANCIIVLYTAQVLPFLLCDKRVAMYVGGV